MDLIDIQLAVVVEFTIQEAVDELLFQCSVN